MTATIKHLSSGPKTIIGMIERGEDSSRKPSRTPTQGKEFQQPEMSLIENAMFQVNPEIDDHEWRKQFFGDMPHYLSRYFAERYNKTFKQKGRSAANLYLLKTVGEKINPRLQKVLDQYRRQFKFRNAYVHNNDLSREKLLAEMDKSEIKKLSQQFADFFVSKLEPLIEIEKANHKDYADVIIAVFENMQVECREFGYTPPYNRNDGLHQSEAECGILRLVCQRAWENKLNKKRMAMREHLAIAVGQVQKAASPYCSRDCMHEWKNQKQRNRDFIKGMSIFDEDSGEEIALYDMFYKSTANPAIRRCELMVRMAGYQSIATAMGCDGLFLTLTAPSKYHNTRKQGGFVDQWLGNSPKEAQRYLCQIWARIRAQLKREELPVFGMRVAEPHHDGTPHWHLLMFMQPEHVDRIREIFISYAINEEVTELFPKVYRKTIVGPLDYRPRCDVKMMDPSKGTATGYIAKYISKNIDGYGMKGELDDETGRDQREMAAHVTAWASRWRIRQFQPIGGAPVTTYRELRRYANNDKNAFKSFVTTLSSKQLHNLFNEQFPDQDPTFMGPQLNFHGPRLNYEAMGSLQRWEVITDKYKPELKSNAAAASDAMKAADKGDFAAYVMAQGGPFVSRKDLLIRNDYNTAEMGNEYGEFVSKLQGFQVVGGDAVNTRTRKWKIQPKSQALLDSEASTSSTEGAEVLNLPEGSSRSSVNNCTPSKNDRLNAGIKALLKRRGIHLDDHLTNVMREGAQIKVGKDLVVKLRQGYYVEGSDKYHPPEVVDVTPEVQNIWDGWNSPEIEIKDTSNYTLGWETWESWDWG
ncbi:replication endonuclease [Moritella sp. Urea-trap-13]|uniref:replication endonuclease n=1 Tax=Moritella sp. Urea-trap-13 TaxID=2058327 RepID=UPI000C33AD7B|nr:replication endonuclease [Moritella sp. Urea-trap-13]PKH06422.1 replication protein [Moritella sp. Urea-trap-13]